MKPPTKSSAFTLIELLVVIAIIALLAGLSIPAVNGVLKRGQSSACLSNLRQIGIATIAYAVDNDMVLPGAGSPPNHWPTTIGSYTGVDSKKSKTIFVCPGCSIPVQSGSEGEVAVTYGMNNALMPRGGTEGKALDLVKNTANLILCADVCQDPGNKGWSPYCIEKPGEFSKTSTTMPTDVAIAPGTDKDTGNIQSMRYRHNGYANAVMCDGSARPFKKGTVTAGNATPFIP